MKIVPHPVTESLKKVAQRVAWVLRECEIAAMVFTQKTASAETIRRIRVAFTLDVYGHLFADDQHFLREQEGLLAGALPPQLKEVTKSDSSKNSSSPKKKGLRESVTP